MFRLLLCLLSSNIHANKVPGRNICGNSKCCRIFMEGKFQGSGCIVKPGLTALLTCAGQRHHIPTRTSKLLGPRSNYSQEWLMSKLQPEHQQKLPSKSVQEIHASKNNGGLWMLHQRCERSSSMQSERMCKGTSISGADGSRLQKAGVLHGWTRLSIPKCCSHWRDSGHVPTVPGALVPRGRWGPPPWAQTFRAPSTKVSL